ncbi:hypothetical protein FHG87_024513 [Trinorchestia longiramus]|nr:hypothetical protein FHG87_024513 [Trinorchestia longiramus]
MDKGARDEDDKDWNGKISKIRNIYDSDKENREHAINSCNNSIMNIYSCSNNNNNNNSCKNKSNSYNSCSNNNNSYKNKSNSCNSCSNNNNSCKNKSNSCNSCSSCSCIPCLPQTHQVLAAVCARNNS